MRGLASIFTCLFVRAYVRFVGVTSALQKRHSVESPYIEAVLKEDLYLEVFQGMPRIKEIHLGGDSHVF